MNSANGYATRPAALAPRLPCVLAIRKSNTDNRYIELRHENKGENALLRSVLVHNHIPVISYSPLPETHEKERLPLRGMWAAVPDDQ